MMTNKNLGVTEWFRSKTIYGVSKYFAPAMFLEAVDDSNLEVMEWLFV